MIRLFFEEIIKYDVLPLIGLKLDKKNSKIVYSRWAVKQSYCMPSSIFVWPLFRFSGRQRQYWSAHQPRFEWIASFCWYHRWRRPPSLPVQSLMLPISLLPSSLLLHLRRLVVLLAEAEQILRATFKCIIMIKYIFIMAFLNQAFITCSAFSRYVHDLIQICKALINTIEFELLNIFTFHSLTIQENLVFYGCNVAHIYIHLLTTCSNALSYRLIPIVVVFVSLIYFLWLKVRYVGNFIEKNGDSDLIQWTIVEVVSKKKLRKHKLFNSELNVISECKRKMKL